MVLFGPLKVISREEMREHVVADELDVHQSSDERRQSKSALFIAKVDLFWHFKIIEHESNLDRERHEGENAL